jgi:hypothetical protein
VAGGLTAPADSQALDGAFISAMHAALVVGGFMAGTGAAISLVARLHGRATTKLDKARAASYGRAQVAR